MELAGTIMQDMFTNMYALFASKLLHSTYHGISKMLKDGGLSSSSTEAIILNSGSMSRERKALLHIKKSVLYVFYTYIGPIEKTARGLRLKVDFSTGDSSSDLKWLIPNTASKLM